jgi:hypothetical protein
MVNRVQFVYVPLKEKTGYLKVAGLFFSKKKCPTKISNYIVFAVKDSGRWELPIQYWLLYVVFYILANITIDRIGDFGTKLKSNL